MTLVATFFLVISVKEGNIASANVKIEEDAEGDVWGDIVWEALVF